MVARHVNDNFKLSKVLEVLALLVKYGYYDDPMDVEEVLWPLVEVMNGLTDLLFPKTSASTSSEWGGGGGGGEWASGQISPSSLCEQVQRRKNSGRTFATRRLSRTKPSLQ